MAGDRSIQIRTQEIINKSAVPITVQDALSQALYERFGDDAAAIRAWAATVGAGAMRGLRKATYELPDNENALFEVPAVFGISTPQGDLLVPKDQANAGHVRQWTREGLQHHSTQRLRFKRAVKELEAVADLADETPWVSARQTLSDRKREELEPEGGE
jgi:hypothetical protein